MQGIFIMIIIITGDFTIAPAERQAAVQRVFVQDMSGQKNETVVAPAVAAPAINAPAVNAPAVNAPVVSQEGGFPVGFLFCLTGSL